MSYAIQSTPPRPVSDQERSEFREAAWQRNNNYWGAALFFFVIAIPSIGILPGVVMLIVAVITFGIAMYRIDADVTAAIATAEQSHARSAKDDAGQLTTDATGRLNKLTSTEQAVLRELRDAAVSLDRARAEFAANAYAPFWELLERAAASLAQARRLRQTLPKMLAEYHHFLQPHSHNFPQRPVSPETLPDQTSLEREFKRILRGGLTNRDFAIIWEFRRTRATIASGFATLEDVVRDVAGELDYSVSMASVRSEDQSSSILDALRQIEKRLR